MYSIKMNADKSLSTTIRATIYQYERNADTIVFLLPKFYGDVSLSDCDVYLEYILQDGIGDTIELKLEPEPYNDGYYMYRLPMDARFTKDVGTIELWLCAIDRQDNKVLESGTAHVKVEKRKDIADYYASGVLSQIDRLAARVEIIAAGKADNLIYTEDDSGIQLEADGVPIGDRVNIVDIRNIDGGTAIGQNGED